MSPGVCAIYKFPLTKMSKITGSVYITIVNLSLTCFNLDCNGKLVNSFKRVTLIKFDELHVRVGVDNADRIAKCLQLSDNYWSNVHIEYMLRSQIQADTPGAVIWDAIALNMLNMTSL